MTMGVELSRQWLVHSVGWTLLHFCWQGAVVAALLWCVLQVVDERRSQLRYAACCVSLGLMVALPAATLFHLGAADYRLALALRDAPMDAGLTLTVRAADAGVGGAWWARAAATLDRSMPWLLLAWMAGAAMFLVRLCVGFDVTRRMRRSAMEAPESLQAMFARLTQAMRLLRPVRLLRSALVEVPTVIGWLRPMVLLPASCFTGLSEMQIEAVLCHELAHIRRHDYLVSVVQSVVESLLFYHPAVWWVSRQMRRERECCCDAVAVAMGGDVLLYARALKSLEERRELYPAMALGANGGVLTMRIKRLLGCSDRSAAAQAASIVLLAAMVVTVGAAVGRLAYAQDSQGESSAEVKQVPPAVQATPESKNAGEPAVPRREAARQAEEAQRLSAEIQGRLEREMRQAQRLATEQKALTEEQQKQMDRAMQQAKMALDRLKSPEFQKQIQASAEAAAKLDAADVQRRMDEAMRSASKALEAQRRLQQELASPEFKKQMEDAKRQAQVNSREFAQQVEQANRIAQERLNSPEFKKQMEEMSARMREQADAMFAKGKMDGAAGHGDLLAEDSPPAAPPAPATSRPMSVSAAVMQGQAIARPQPVYPPAAKAAHVQGIVVLHAMISKEGTVEALQVVSGPTLLRSSALDAVRQWTYKPYLLNGEPQEVETTINVNYTFAEPPPAKEPDAGPQEDEATGSTPRRIGGGVSAPLLIYEESPQYSPEARKAKTNGMVLVSLVVDANGNPQMVHVVRGVGMGLDERALEAVREYKFKPAMENGKPVPVQLNIEVNFKIF
jgi:TonB family protein